MEAVESINHQFAKITDIFSQGLPGKDPRLLAQCAEKLAAAVNTYSVLDSQNLPNNPPFIVVANHNVIRGRVTKYPYDGYIINHFLRQERGLSPLWLADPQSQYFLKELRYFRYILRPVLGAALRTIYETTSRVALHKQTEGAATLFATKVSAELQGNGVVGIFPTGTLYSQRIRSGCIFLSCNNKVGQDGVPIVPIKIDRPASSQPTKYRLQVRPTMHPTFEDVQPNLREIKTYREQLRSSLLPSNRSPLI